MRALVEQTKEAIGIGHRHFVPTPNVRNPAMLQEATEYATAMHAFKNSLKTYEKRVMVFLKSIPPLARGNLPRVWDASGGPSDGGLVEPVRPEVSSEHPTLIGGVMDERLVDDSAQLLRARLEQDIVRPIDQWLEALYIVKGRMRKVDGLRLDLDGRRRKVESKQRRQLRSAEGRGERGAIAMSEMPPAGAGGYPASAAGGAGPPMTLTGARDEFASERAREDSIRLQRFASRKLDVARTTYEEQERLVWEQLSGLVRDAAWLKSYVAGAILVVKESLQGAAAGLGESKQPLPGFELLSGLAQGSIADNMHYIERMPTVTAMLPSGMRGTQAPIELHAHRSTAEPLSMASDTTYGQASRSQIVPPVARGMPEVPMGGGGGGMMGSTAGGRGASGAERTIPGYAAAHKSLFEGGRMEPAGEGTLAAGGGGGGLSSPAGAGTTATTGGGYR